MLVITMSVASKYQVLYVYSVCVVDTFERQAVNDKYKHGNLCVCK